MKRRVWTACPHPPFHRLAIGVTTASGIRRLVRRPQRRSVDSDGYAVVLQAVEHGVDQGLALEQLMPLPIGEVGGNQRGLAAIAQVEELEEGVDLFGLHGR